MALSNWNNTISTNWNPFDHAERRMSQMMRHFFNEDGIMSASQGRGDKTVWGDRSQQQSNVAVPAVDVIEAEKAWLIHAELPGVQKDDIKLVIKNDALVLSGETKSMRNVETDTMRYQERHVGQFSRTMRLPDGVERDNIDAKFEDGVLTVTLPKGAEETPTKSITIS